jgi:hypothetical protein
MLRWIHSSACPAGLARPKFPTESDLAQIRLSPNPVLLESPAYLCGDVPRGNTRYCREAGCQVHAR